MWEQGCGKKNILCCLLSCLKTQYFSGDKIEKNGVGVACGRIAVKRGLYMVLVGNPSKETTLEKQAEMGG